MARLIYSATASLDGYINDAQGAFDFTAPDAEVHAFVNDREREIGTYLLGRRVYDVMTYWDTAPVDDVPSGEGGPAEGAEAAIMADYARIWRRIDKVVYSRSLDTVTADRTRLERDFDPEAVRALKEAAHRDLSVGGAELAGQALAAGLVDLLRVYIVPVVVGGGTRLLPDGLHLELELVDQHRFTDGTVHLLYAVEN
ncbi:dihydrofolate reductase [Conyzicola nivalis]|uniref:Dihydrofolate reductase n=1 Tax=Conyzicola nivalis TaxID=1477021 RepID=A0ABV2QQA1_9MICO